MSTAGRPAEERDAVATVRAFVDQRVRPVARELGHADRYPAGLVEGVTDLGANGSQPKVIVEQLVRRGGLPTGPRPAPSPGWGAGT